MSEHSPREKGCIECDTTSEICFLKPDENLRKLTAETDEIRWSNIDKFNKQAKKEIEDIILQALSMRLIYDKLQPKLEACKKDRIKNEAAVNDVGNLLNCHYLVFGANNTALGPVVASGGRHEESSTLHKLVKWIRESG